MFAPLLASLLTAQATPQPTSSPAPGASASPAHFYRAPAGWKALEPHGRIAAWYVRDKSTFLVVVTRSSGMSLDDVTTMNIQNFQKMRDAKLTSNTPVMLCGGSQARLVAFTLNGQYMHATITANASTAYVGMLFEPTAQMSKEGRAALMSVCAPPLQP